MDERTIEWKGEDIRFHFMCGKLPLEKGCYSIRSHPTQGEDVYADVPIFRGKREPIHVFDLRE